MSRLTKSEAPWQNLNIQVEITDASEFHCFRLILNPSSAPGERIEIMLHGRSLVDLIHKCSAALCDWQAETTDSLLKRKGGNMEKIVYEVFNKHGRKPIQTGTVQ